MCARDEGFIFCLGLQTAESAASRLTATLTFTLLESLRTARSQIMLSLFTLRVI